MTVISGKDAYIDGVNCMTAWQANEKADLKEYASSCTDGGTASTDGNVGWDGGASGIGHTPPLLPDGNDFTFKGVVDNSGGDAIAYDGDIIVASATVDIPVADGGPITWNSSWNAQGVLAEGTTGAADATYVEAPSAKLATIKIGPTIVGLAVATALANVQKISLTFSRPLTQYISNGQMFYLPGNLSCSISFDILDRVLVNALYSLNLLTIVEIECASGLEYRLPIKFGEKTGLDVNVETRAPVGYTVNGNFAAVVPTAISASLRGFIKLPDDTYFFGIAPT